MSEKFGLSENIWVVSKNFGLRVKKMYPVYSNFWWLVHVHLLYPVYSLVRDVPSVLIFLVAGTCVLDVPTVLKSLVTVSG